MKQDDVKKMDVNQDEKDAEESIGKRVKPDMQSDKISLDEAKKIVKFVLQDVETGYAAQAEWLEKKKIELKHIHNRPPSEIENLSKKGWMSDRNLGLMSGILDIYQATLLATVWNPSSIHYVPTESNDIDNSDNLSKFTKWGLGKHEANFDSEADDFIHNKVSHGFSAFKVYWEVNYQYVDKRIPVYSKDPYKKNVVESYDIKSDWFRTEKGVIKNIANIDDILIPSYGDDIQKLDFVIEVRHNTFNDFILLDDMGMLVNFDKTKFENLFRAGLDSIDKDDIRNKKLDLMKLREIPNENLTNITLDMYEWYGYYERNGIREKYCFVIEPVSETMMYAKPVRKLNRSGKVPIVGGPLRRVPGILRGGSLVLLVAPVINALNNNYNQTSDFQYIENMPFGFANLSEWSRKSVYDIEPGVIYNVDDENISDKIFFPNLTRSLAWSYKDKQFLMEMIERLTGAASYFLTSDSKDTTATRDAIVNEKSETKFGLWVKRIQQEFCEAINMWMQLYQDNAPKDLAERVIGEDGKGLFKNLSINDLRGGMYPQMVPDITHGSKSFEQKIALWGFQVLQQGSFWLSPQVNPRGNWKLTHDAMKKMGYLNPEDYLLPMPKADIGMSKEIDDELRKIKQGDSILPPPEGVTPQVIEHYYGHQRQKEENYNEISEEYRPNFDAHMFATYINFMEFVRQQQEQKIAERVAMNAVGAIKQAATPTNPNVPQLPTPMDGQMGGDMAQTPNMGGMAQPEPQGDLMI